MIEENMPELEKSNATNWWREGYKGQGVTVLVLDDEGDRLDWFDDKITTGAKYHEGIGHNTNVTKIIRTFAPEANIIMYNCFGKHSDTDKETLEFIKTHDIDLINISYSTFKRDMYDEINKLGIPMICASGNQGRDNEISYPAKLPYTISVGAVNERMAHLYYSNEGPNLDCVGFTNIHVWNSGKDRTFMFTGTSCATPYVAGLLAVYLSYIKENVLPKPTLEELKKFIYENTIDLYDEGHDYKTGYGLFILPEEVKKVDKQGFIHSISEGAKDGYRQYRILPSLTIAQAILESAWGTKHIANNLFGIKATSSWNGNTKEVWTTEYIDGKYVKVKAIFRTYDSFNDSVRDHNKLLGELSRYVKVRQANDYRTACLEVWKAGYATDPNYPYKLINIIETYNLDSYDREVMKEMTEHWSEKHWKSLNEKGIIVHEKRFDEPITRGETMALIDRLTDWFKENKEV